MNLTAMSAKVAKIFTATLCALRVLCREKYRTFITSKILILGADMHPEHPPHIKIEKPQSSQRTQRRTATLCALWVLCG
jgi:hypothetical protein